MNDIDWQSKKNEDRREYLASIIPVHRPLPLEYGAMPVCAGRADKPLRDAGCYHNLNASLHYCHFIACPKKLP
jgi:hypothetical protein